MGGLLGGGGGGGGGAKGMLAPLYWPPSIGGSSIGGPCPPAPSLPAPKNGTLNGLSINHTECFITDVPFRSQINILI